MEHATMSFNGSFGAELYIHELAHQWFGDYITCGSWADLWLNESFATFCTTLFYERVLNGFYRNAWFKGLHQRVTSQGVHGSVYATDTLNVPSLFSGPLRYYKGAWVLSQLRYLVGDEAFFAGIRSYLADTTLAYGYAYTPQLQQHFEAASARSLQRYFDDWVYAESYPNYDYAYRNLPDGTVRLSLVQRAANGSGHVFAQPLQLVVHGRSLQGNPRTDTLRIEVTETRTELELPLGYWVDSLLFNPLLLSVAGNFAYNPGLLSNCPDCNLRYYPNPAQSGIWLVHPQPHLGSTGIRLFDATGRLALQLTWDVSTYKRVDLQGLLPRGTYTLQAQEAGVWRTLGPLVWVP
jgi:hypothetical protein